VKFLRHLSAVVLAVADIVGLGILCAHASGGGPGNGRGPSRAPSREASLRPGQVKSGATRGQSDNGFHLADIGDLTRTCVIEAVLAAVVIAVSAVRRRRRRMRARAGHQGPERRPRPAARPWAPRPHPPARPQEATCPMSGAGPRP
jgi:hypothetical protein